MAWAVPAGAVGTATPSVPTIAAPTTTTTLPPLPQVALSFTDGQKPASLLSNAISLSSIGVDDSALLTAVDATQVKLDADALIARSATDAADAAEQRARGAQSQARAAQADFDNMASAVRQAVVDLYMSGPDPLRIDPKAGAMAVYAQDYTESALGPYGVLAQRQSAEEDRSQALHLATEESRIAAHDAARAGRAMSDQRAQLDRLQHELASVSAASAEAVAADHIALAREAGKALLSASSLEFKPATPLPAPGSTTSVALTWAFAELGKPYVWGATGPDSFDCSGLTQFVWKAAGVSIPRVAADQDSWTIPVPLSKLLPGDLVFFGTTDIHHVGIYIGDGLMINAPHTGTVVQVSSIWWSDLAGFGRVHYPGTPVPAHDTPSLSKPATPAVVPTAGRVPSQTKPPAGWKPHRGSTTPIRLGPPVGLPTVEGPTSTTTTSAPTTATTSPATTLPAETTTVAPSDSTTTTTGPATPTSP